MFKIALIYFLLLCTYTFCVDSSKLAVVEVRAEGLADRQTAIALQENLVRIAQSVPYIDALPLDLYSKRALEKGLIVPVDCDGACFASIGEALAVDLILQVEVRRSSNGLDFDFRLYDVHGKQMLRSVTLEGGNLVGSQMQGGVERTLAAAPTRQQPETLNWTAAGIAAGFVVVAGSLILTAPSHDNLTLTNHYVVTSPLATVAP